MRYLLICAGLFCGLSVNQANAVQCSATLATDPSPIAALELQVAADADCNLYWSGFLPRSRIAGRRPPNDRVPVEIMVQTGLRIPSGFAERVKTGLFDADNALSELGSRASVGHSVTVIITGHETEDTLASANLLRLHCYITVEPASWQRSAELGELEFTMAHELFHCVQGKSLPRGVFNAGLTPDATGEDVEANKWWVEGSAEWFGHVVYPGASNYLAAHYEINADLRPLNKIGFSNMSPWVFFT